MASTISDCLAVYGGAKAQTIVFCETKKECNELIMNPAIKVNNTLTPLSITHPPSLGPYP